MADEIKLKAPTVEQQVNVVINGEEKLKSFASTLENISSNKNLQKYWKDQKQLIEDVSNAYGNFTKNASKNNALELMKTTNALKALSDVDISSLIPDFKNFSQALENANKVAGNLDSAFSVSSFKNAFSSFETLRAYGIDLENFFKHFELDINVTNLQESLRLAQQETRRVRRELSETQEELSSKKIELASFIDGSGLTEQIEKLRYLEDEIRYVREQASEEFKTFLKGNDFSGWDLDENGAFERYFNEIREGTLTAKEAIANFKHEYSYLLQDKFTESGGLFNIQQVQEFEGKLTSVLNRVEEIYRQMNDIVENGVMTKAMQNLSVDNSISQSQRDLFANVLKDEEALSSIAGVLKKIIDESATLQGVNNKTFDEEQFNRLIVLFEKIESSLSSMKAVFVDVGDGEEFSPLLKMIDNVQSSIKELSTSVSGIKLDVNMDLGSEVNERMNQKVSQSLGRQLEAYKKLYDAIRNSGKLTKEMFKFTEPDDVSTSELIGIYKGMINRVEQKYGKDTLKSSISGYADYIKEINNATAQFNRATNKKNVDNPLGDLFGKNELIEVVSQLGLIADRLSEISTTVSGLGDVFKNTFKEGFNVSASVEEIEKLTHRVKELEDELSKVKASPVETNISSPIKDTFQGDKIQETVGVADKLEEEIQEITVATDKAGKALEEYKEKWKVLKQVGDVGDDKYSATFEKNAGQIESVIWKAKRDADRNVLFDSNGEKEYEMLSVTISNYQKLESVIVSADNELRKLEDRRQNLLKQNPTASTSGLDAQIAYQKNYISLLEQTVKHISQAGEYLLEEQQIIEARNKAEKEYQLTKDSKQDESVAKDYQKRNDAITKANRLLNTQEKIVEHIAKTYDKALNPDLEKSVNNPKDLKELAQEKAKIQTLINQLKNAPRDASNEQEYLKLEKLIAGYKDLADYKKKANNPTKQELGGQKLETLVAQTVAEYDKLIIRAEKYGNATKEIVEKLRQQRDLLAQTDSNGKYTTNANDFYSARDVLKVQKADFGVFEAEAKSAKKSDIDMANQKLEEQKRIYKELNNEIDRYATVSKRIANGKALSSDEEELAKLQSRIEELQNEPILSKEQLEASQLRLEKLEATLEDIQEITRNNNIDSMQSEIDAYNKRYNNLNIKPSDKNRSADYQKAIDNYKTSIGELETFLNRLRTSSAPITEEIENQWNEITLKVDKASDAVKAFSAAEKGSDEDSRMKEIDKLTKYLDANTRISKEAKQQLQGYLALLKSGDPSVNIKKIHTEWTRVAVAEREAGREGKRFWDILSNKVLYGAAAKLATYYLSFYDFIRYARNGINAVRELDTALVDLQKTTTMSTNQLEDFYYASNDVAKQMGVTTSEIINQASAWSRLGYSSKEAATEMAALSSQFASISPGMDLDTATDGLVSTMKAFDIEVEDVERRIMDNINRIGNTAATSNDEIVDMLTRSSAAMAVANNTLEETIALETAAVEITRNAESTGTAFKTISMRIRGYDEETEELSEDLKNISGDIADLTKTSKTPGGISLFTDENKTTYKSTYQILKEISEIYDELTDKQQADLLEKLAGKRGGQVVGSLLLNFEAAEKALKEMEQAAGSADAEMSIIEESIDYKLNALKETWVGNAQDLLKRDDFGKLVDGLTKLSEAIGWVIDKAGLLGTVGLGVGLFKGIKNFGRPKMFGLCFEIAEYHKCSLGY